MRIGVVNVIRETFMPFPCLRKLHFVLFHACTSCGVSSLQAVASRCTYTASCQSSIITNCISDRRGTRKDNPRKNAETEKICLI